jgi:tol-pal system protein YbgF
MRRTALALLLLGTSPWCAAGLFSDDEAHKKIADLQQQVQVLETRLAAAENLVQTQNNGMMGLVSQIDALKAELSKLRGQNEVYAHDIETTQKRQRDLYADLDGRMRKLERGGVQAAAGEAQPAGGEVPVMAATAPQAVPAASSAGDESKAYESALNQFKVGNYQGAIASFQNFATAYPNSSLTASAYYWIGNSYFNLRDYKSAIASQQKLISQFPASPKVPDALLNVASCQQGLGDMSAAKRTLEELVSKHPISNAADLAKKRLANLK